MRRILVILVLLLLLAPAVRADSPRARIDAREAVGWSLVVLGIIGAVGGGALVAYAPESRNMAMQRTDGWVAVGFSGATFLCGVVALNVPPRSRVQPVPGGIGVRF